MDNVTPTWSMDNKTNVPTTQDSEDIERIRGNWLFAVNGVMHSTIALIGLIANIVNIIVLSMLIRRGRRSLYRILLAMACADIVVMTIVLANSLMFWVWRPAHTLPHVKNITYSNSSLQKSQYWFYQTWFLMIIPFETISNWCAVLMCAVRTIAIYFPLKVSNIFSSKVISRLIIITFLFGFLGMIPKYTCYRLNRDGNIIFLENCRRSQISLIISNPLPLVLTLLLTIALLVRLGNQQKAVNHLLTASVSEERAREQRQLTITLSLVCVFYILMNTANFIYWVFEYNSLWKTLDISNLNRLIFYCLSNLLSYISYACNFFIYIVFNRTFRLEFKYTILCKSAIPGRTSLSRKTTVTAIHSLPLRDKHRHDDTPVLTKARTLSLLSNGTQLTTVSPRVSPVQNIQLEQISFPQCNSPKNFSSRSWRNGNVDNSHIEVQL